MLSRARAEAALGATFPLRPRRRVSGRPYGTMRASRRGGRSDPVSSRLYRPGDDLRLIDRHASARLAAHVGPYAEWNEPFRLAANVHRCYREFAGIAWDASFDSGAVMADVRALKTAMHP